MDPTQPIPEAISHRQLADLLQNAMTDPALAEVNGAAEHSTESNLEFEALLQAYGQASVQLLKAFEAAGDALGQGRSARQLMAMGALRTHAQMALRALAASQA